MGSAPSWVLFGSSSSKKYQISHTLWYTVWLIGISFPKAKYPSGHCVFTALKGAAWTALGWCMGVEGLSRKARLPKDGCTLFSPHPKCKGRGRAANLPGWKCAAQTSLLGLYLFVKPPDAILQFFQELLLQQICRERCTYCLVTKRVLEMEKALFKENMTFQWKSNFACCF